MAACPRFRGINPKIGRASLYSHGLGARLYIPLHKRHGSGMFGPLVVCLTGTLSVSLSLRGYVSSRAFKPAWGGSQC
jgi:hypothetical protein